MTTGHSDDANNLSGAYAVDAVSDAERATHENELGTSEHLRSETTELQDTAVLLGLAAAPIEPSADLKARLMAQVAVTPQKAPLAAAERPATIREYPSAGPAELKARSRWARPVVAITSVAAAVALVVGGIAIGTSVTQPPQSYQAAQMLKISEAADVQELTTELAGGEQVTLRWSPALATSALIVDGMAPAPADSVYQIWYIDDSGARSAGFLPVTGEGESWRVLEGTMTAGDKVGVTVEPTGGSTIPTTDPVMVIQPA